MWTYDPSCVVTKDQVRLLIGDTIDVDPQLHDEEITFLSTQASTNIYTKAAQCARAIAAKYARQVQKSVSGLSIGAQERQRHYLDMAATLDALAVTIAVSGIDSAGVWAGGLYLADVETNEADESIIQPQFRTVGIARDRSSG